MQYRATCAGLLTGAIMLLCAPSAFAATVASFAGTTLSVTGDATGETITLTESAPAVVVTATGVGAIALWPLRRADARWHGVASAVAGGMMLSASVFALADKALRRGSA